MNNHTPKNWQKVKLENVLDLLIDHRGKTPKKLGGNWSSKGIPALSAKNIKGGQIISEKDIRYVTKELYNKWMPEKLEAGDILMTSEAPLGELFYLKKKTDYVLSQRLFGLRAAKGKIDSRFLYYYLLSPLGRHELKRRISGTAAEGIQQSELRQIEICLPKKMTEQKRIASILSAFDEKIKLNNKINQTLEKITEAIFKEWFINFRFPGWEKVRFVDSKLGKIPEGWKVVKLPEVFDFLEGPGIRHWQYVPKGCPFINIRLIKNNDIDVNSANCISEEEVNTRYKHFLLRERDIVVSTSGTLGRSAIVRKEHLPLMLNTSVIRFRPRDGKSYVFMYLFLKSRYFKHKLSSMASGSAQPNFGPVHLRQIELIVPEKKVLDDFCKLVGPIYDKIVNNLSENQKLSAMRDLLLPKLMGGGVKYNFLSRHG